MQEGRPSLPPVRLDTHGEVAPLLPPCARMLLYPFRARHPMSQVPTPVDLRSKRSHEHVANSSTRVGGSEYSLTLAPVQSVQFRPTSGLPAIRCAGHRAWTTGLDRHAHTNAHTHTQTHTQYSKRERIDEVRFRRDGLTRVEIYVTETRNHHSAISQIVPHSSVKHIPVHTFHPLFSYLCDPILR